jgi:hypothetical protein
VSNIEDVYYGQTYPTRRFTKWAECAMCNHVAPADQMSTLDGRTYCHRYDCYEEALDRKITQRQG